MSYYSRFIKVSELIGKTLSDVVASDDTIVFTASDGEVFTMYHSQNCCESVYIESIVGDLQDLVGNPILVAEEVSSDGTEEPRSEYTESYTWTFYKFATVKGYVDIRWYGESNGYYSEDVDFIRGNPYEY